MTNKERCIVAMLAYAFIDTSTQNGIDTLRDMLKSLLITFDEFKDFIDKLPSNENTRFLLYGDIRKLSSDDKTIACNIIANAYLKGGKAGTDYAVYYFKEIINNCNLATVVHI